MERVWVDEDLVKKRVKEMAYSLSYVSVDYLRKRLGVTELKEDVSLVNPF